MKILLLGDFSGYGVNLKKGLASLGHDVVIAAHSDNWKKFTGDIDLSKDKKSRFPRLAARAGAFQLLKEITGYDVVQLIDPFTFYMNYFPRKYFYQRIFEENGRSFLIAANMDAFFWRHSKEYLDYTPYEEMKKYDWDDYTEFKTGIKAYNFNEYIATQVDGIIAVMHDYKVGYIHNFAKKLATIPLPIDLEEIKCTEINPARKIKFLHGLNRYGFKGTRYIVEAFEELSKKYPNDVEFVLNERMPFEQYKKVLASTHVVIDQVNSYSYGMNALYAMALGKVVMTGAEPEAMDTLGVSDCPAINLRPDKNYIIKQVENMLDLQGQLPYLGHESRKFVEKYHNSAHIARKYIDFWDLYAKP